MPRIGDLFRFEISEVLSVFELRSAGLDQGDATDLAGQPHRQGHADRPGSDDRDLNLSSATFGQTVARAYQKIADSISLR